LWSGLADNWPVSADQPDVTTVQHRLILAQVLEAVRALEEGVLQDIREGDVGAILGWGFMPWSGGPFSWLDMIGAGKAVEICDALAKGGNKRFEAPALLREIAKSGETFYERFGPKEENHSKCCLKADVLAKHNPRPETCEDQQRVFENRQISRLAGLIGACEQANSDD